MSGCFLHLETFLCGIGEGPQQDFYTSMNKVCYNAPT